MGCTTGRPRRIGRKPLTRYEVSINVRYVFAYGVIARDRKEARRRAFKLFFKDRRVRKKKYTTVKIKVIPRS